MAEPKFRKFYQLMLEKNQAIFDNFLEIHNNFSMNPAKFETEFHTEGRKVLDIIRDWERRLCFGTEKGQYGKFSANLSEKFWGEVKTLLPLIEEVGVKRSK